VRRSTGRRPTAVCKCGKRVALTKWNGPRKHTKPGTNQVCLSFDYDAKSVIHPVPPL
jgi:hypothetical protein